MFEVDEENMTCLHCAVIGGSLPVMRYIVDQCGFDLSLRAAVSYEVVHDLIHPSIDFYKIYIPCTLICTHAHTQTCTPTTYGTPACTPCCTGSIMQTFDSYCSPPLVDNMPTSMILF